MSQIGRSGTKLSFSGRKPNMTSNSRLGCFDPYWGRTNKYEEYDKKDIYFKFDYLHIQTEEWLEDLNKMLNYIQIELIDKQEVPVYAWNDSYGKRLGLSKPTFSKGKEKKVETKKMLTGMYKVVIDDFFLDKTTGSKKYSIGYNYGKVAQTIIYLCHHILCSVAVSEAWLTDEEKINKIDYADYGGKDFFDFVAYLNNNRNTGTNRKLATYRLKGSSIKQIGNKKKIFYLCEYPNTFKLGHQTQSLTTFSKTLKDMEARVALISRKKRILETKFGKPGTFSIIKQRYRKYNSYTGYKYEEITDLVRIKKVDVSSMQVRWEIIGSNEKFKMKNLTVGVKGFPTNSFSCRSSDFIKDSKTGRYKLKPFSPERTVVQSVSKLSKRHKGNKAVLDILDRLDKEATALEKNKDTTNERLKEAVKAFEKTKMPSADDSDFMNKFSEYTHIRTTFFGAKKNHDNAIYNVSLLNNISREIKEKIGLDK